MKPATELLKANGLKFTHSNHVDSHRQQCSLVTLQSDPQGYFAILMDHLRNRTGNYVNVLWQISQMDDPCDSLNLIKFASNVEGMVIFSPKAVFKAKNHNEAKEAKEKGNLMFKKGDFRQAFMYYSVAVVKAVHPENVSWLVIIYPWNS